MALLSAKTGYMQSPKKLTKKCIDLNSCKYFTFKQILKKLNVKELSGAPPKALPEHENIRGKDYYK